MQQDIAVLQDVKHADILLQPRRQVRGKPGKGQFRFIHQVAYRHQPVQVYRPVYLVEVIFIQFKLLQQETSDIIGTIIRYLQPDRVVEPS